MTLGQKESQPFLGRDLGHQADYSGQVAFLIDQEIRHLIDEAHDEALEILVENDDVLEHLAESLLEHETVDGDLLDEVFAPIRKRPSRAVMAPQGKGPEEVLDALRRVDGSGRRGNTSGNGARAVEGSNPATAT